MHRNRLCRMIFLGLVIVFFLLYLGAAAATVGTNGSPNGTCSNCGNELLTASADQTAYLTEAQVRAEIGQIANEIQAKGMKWVPGETSVSRLSPAARKHLLGLKIPAGITTSTTPASSSPQTTGSSLTSIDWRNNNGNWVTPVRNQGNCASCWAFAAVGSMEARMEIAANSPSLAPNLAEQELVSCSGGGDCENGGYVNLAYDYAESTGLLDESCFPYRASDVSCTVCSSPVRHRIYTWSTVGSSDDSVKTALTRGPIATTMYVYSDFFSYTSGIYQPTGSASIEGTHAITLVGWGTDPTAGLYWIAKNSWGTSWGESGFFRIKAGTSSFNGLGVYEPSVPTPQDTVKYVTVTDPGSGYTSVPGVTITGGGGSGATATASISGRISGVTVTDPGSGYTSVPGVTFTGGGGSGATATATMQSAPSPLASITVTNGGSGYTTAPAVMFTGGGGSGATATATLTSSQVTGITITSGGSGYTSAPLVYFIGGGGSGAKGTATIQAGKVTGVTMTNVGSGYTSSPTIYFWGGGGSGATGVATVGKGVARVTLTNKGSGYTSAPGVTFTGGGGSGAVATAVLAATMSVSTVSVTDQGSGYTSVPVVGFSGGGGSGAAAAAILS